MIRVTLVSFLQNSYIYDVTQPEKLRIPVLYIPDPIINPRKITRQWKFTAREGMTWKFTDLSIAQHTVDVHTEDFWNCIYLSGCF